MDKSFIGLSTTIWEDISWTWLMLLIETIEIDVFACICIILLMLLNIIRVFKLNNNSIR